MLNRQGEVDLLYEGGKIVGFPTILYHNEQGIMILSLHHNDAMISFFRNQTETLKYKENSYKQLYTLSNVNSYNLEEIRELFDSHVGNAVDLLKIVEQQPVLFEQPILILLVLERIEEYA